MTTVIVVGGGLAGLSCAMKLAEQGVHVKLFSLTRCKRSHSVCAQGGINASFNSKNEGDSPLIHAYETIKGGDFLADQPPVVEMCLAAPGIIRMMERMGCPFNRTAEGNLDVRRFGGSLYHRTVFCGASTGQQLLYTLDEQVRRYETMQLIEKFENHEFLRLVFDDTHRACGIVYHDLFNLKISTMQGDAVIIASGGLGMLFKKSTNSIFCTGAANGRLFQQGMLYANGEFIQIHPTAIPGEDKLRLMSESARGEGGRLWVIGDSSKKITTSQGTEIPCGRTGEPWYFLEELYPAFGNLVPRDIAAREILRITDMGLGIDHKMEVFLDVSHLPKEKLHNLESILDIYKKFTGFDPKKVPMKIFPAVHYSMGGAWVDYPAAEDPDRWTRFRHMTNIQGCFTIGESDFLYHGANRLGANSLLSCIFSGLTVATEIPRYIQHIVAHCPPPKEQYFEEARQQELTRKKEIFSRSGKENIHLLHEELAHILIQHATVQRNNTELTKTLTHIKQIRERLLHISLDDTGTLMNQTYAVANQMDAMVELALIIVKGALLRNESRGSHFKPEFPARDDTQWLKTSLASYSTDEPIITYTSVDTRYVHPTLRDYTTDKKETPMFQNLPENIPLPV